MATMRRSPSALTAELLKEQGYIVDTVERWLPGARIRVDLFGFIDQIALKDGETLAIQATSWTNVSSRVKKIAECECLGAVRKANWKILVIGWKHLGGTEYAHKIVDVS
jgi:hypothetical protein